MSRIGLVGYDWACAVATEAASNAGPIQAAIAARSIFSIVAIMGHGRLALPNLAFRRWRRRARARRRSPLGGPCHHPRAGGLHAAGAAREGPRVGRRCLLTVEASRRQGGGA